MELKKFISKQINIEKEIISILKLKNKDFKINDNYKINKNVKKYSLFNTGNKSIPNITLFKEFYNPMVVL